MTLKQALAQSHEYAKKIVHAGDTVIDATMGNGHDTAFLAELVGDAGKVYAFDIQQEAVENTRARLEKLGLSEWCILINDSHDRLDQYVCGPIKLAMFNLGYRPGGDHSLCTRGETTMRAIKAALDKLTAGGLIIVVIYHGGDSGFEERDYLLNELPKLNSGASAVMMTEFLNLPNNPPILICIEKLT